MNQEDLQEQLHSLRQTLEETRQQLSSNPALTPDTVEAMLAPLHRKVAVLEDQIRAARFDQRGWTVGTQVNVAVNYYFIKMNLIHLGIGA